MKTTLYNFLFFFILSPSVLLAENGPGDFIGRHTREKKISKTYKVAADATLKINNSYGNIDLKTWDQNTINIEVLVKANGNDEQKVREKLDEINVEFQHTNAGVSARTIFAKENSSWLGSLFSGSSNVNIEVNYIVRAPATNNIDFSNDYGSIFVDKLTGNAKLSCDYGRLDVGELQGSSNHISFDYSRNSRFGYINRAIITADYSEFTVEDAKSIDLNADYTNSKIGRIELLQFSCDYGSLTVDKVKRITGSGDYLSTRIGDLHQTADLNFDYGSASIGRIVKGAGEIKINSDYTGLKIGYDESHPFSFSLNTSYGSIKGMNGFEINKQQDSHSSKSYSGYYLNKANSSNVVIKSSYASVSFQQQ